LGEKPEAIAAAKFDAVEIFENDLVTFNGTPSDVRPACAEIGLGIVALQPFRDFEGMPAGQRERVLARAERKFDVMQELGCDLLMICSNVAPESLGGIDRAAADLCELGERAARRGMRIAFEALAWGRHINDYRDAREAVRRADHPAVGLVLEKGSEYLQVYTESFDQRFFFEIVQRRGYRGYGAANAPVRLAAQARLSAGGDALAARLR
jgi:4-hydroxyphenylpyruvate dioxygenase